VTHRAVASIARPILRAPSFPATDPRRRCARVSAAALFAACRSRCRQARAVEPGQGLPERNQPRRLARPRGRLGEISACSLDRAISGRCRSLVRHGRLGVGAHRPDGGKVVVAAGDVTSFEARRNAYATARGRADGQSGDELVFAPLGGVGEIGMNSAVYGSGPQPSENGSRFRSSASRSGAMNCLGIDLVMPDIAFLLEERPQSPRARAHPRPRRPFRGVLVFGRLKSRLVGVPPVRRRAARGQAAERAGAP